MLGTALLITLLVLGVGAFLKLRRESAIRREFGVSPWLDALSLMYPLGPLALLVGPMAWPRILSYLFAIGLFGTALFIAAKDRSKLERAGTDRVKHAIAATNSAALGAIVGFIYLGIAATLALVVFATQGQSPGA